MRVTAPNRNYNGSYGADVFVRGVCENASERHRGYYVRAGYGVDGDEPVKPEAPEPKPVVEEEKPKADPAVSAPPRSATTDEWREFAEAAGIEVADDAKRSEIIAAYEAATN